MTFEYKVVPAPTRGRKVRGVKTPADRFARALEDAINALAGDGWEYLRTDTLPAEERQGLAGRTTVYQNMLVFRRAVAVSEDAATSVVAPSVAVTQKPVNDRPGDEPAAAPAPANALDTMIAEEIAAARAPKLPSADAAQSLPESSGPPVLSASRRDMAAE